MIDYERPPDLPRFHHLKGRLSWLRWNVLNFPGKDFEFRCSRYRYFAHVYNQTWKNERAVEIPIALEVLRKTSGGKVLEVGNVLSHYARTSHEVIDKYEKGRGIRNEDVRDFNPGCRYDLIISVSTLEHVGWDENPRQPEKAVRAIQHLSTQLVPGGQFFMTVPVGHNLALDAYLREAGGIFNELHFMKRVSVENDWIETGPDEAWRCAYGRPFPFANGLVFATLNKKG